MSSKSQHPILLVSGSGHVGRWTAQDLRAAHLGLPLLIGGRDVAKAQETSAEFGLAQSLAIDPASDDLGLGGRQVGAVAVRFTDERAAGRRFAHSLGVPGFSISPGIIELMPEVAVFMQRPG